MTRLVIVANSIEELGGAQRVVHVLAQGLALPEAAFGLAFLDPRLGLAGAGAQGESGGGGFAAPATETAVQCA